MNEAGITRDELRAELVQLELRLVDRLRAELEKKADHGVVEGLEKRMALLEEHAVRKSGPLIETLLGLCDFIVASRPGIRADALRLVIPPELLGRPPARDAESNGHAPEGPVIAHLRRTTVYLLDSVSSEVSATDVRRRARQGQSIHGLVSARVEEYILKQGLYR